MGIPPTARSFMRPFRFIIPIVIILSVVSGILWYAGSIWAQQGAHQSHGGIIIGNERVKGGIINQSTVEAPELCVSMSNSFNELKPNTDSSGVVEIYQVDQAYVLEYAAYDDQGWSDQASEAVSEYPLLGTVEQVPVTDSCETITLPTEDPGIYGVRLRFGDYEATHILIRAPFGVLAKEADQSMLFWAQDYATGSVISDADISVYSVNQTAQEISSTTTQSDGTASVPRSDQADFALVDYDGSTALVPLNMRTLDGRKYFISFGTKQPDHSYFIFTDRPIYQPGETISFKAFIRTDNDAQYTIPSGTARVRIHGGPDEPAYQQDLPINEYGGIDGQYTLAEDAPLGNYRITVSIGEEESWYNRGNNSFTVGFYEKPDVTLDIETATSAAILGDDIQYSVSGQYLFGQPLRNQTIDIKTTASRAYMSSYLQSQTDIDSILEWSQYGIWNTENVSSQKIELDSTGQKTHQLETKELRLENDAFPKVFTITARREEMTGTANQAAANVLVFGGEYRIMRDGSYSLAFAGQPLTVPVQLVPNTDIDLENRTLDVAVSRATWEPQPVRGQEKSPAYEKKESPVSQQTVTTDANGTAEILIPDTQDGTYTITVTGTDSRDNVIIQEFTQYVWSTDNTRDISSDNEDSGHKPLIIQPDADTYKPGDTATITVTADQPDRPVLLTLDRGFMHRYYLVELEGGQGQVTVPLEESDMPNIYLTAQQFRQSSLLQENEKIIVSARQQQLDISLEPSVEEAGPGETVEVTVRTTDHQGNPVSSEVALWSVDQSIFELVNTPPAQLYNIFEIFWYERFYQTEMAHSLETIRGGQPGAGGGCFAAGTQVLMADGTTKPIEDIEVGDQVRTRSGEDDAELVTAAVTHTHQYQADGYLIINGSLRVTPNHKIFLNGSWQEAAAIQPGDTLIHRDGSSIEVFSVEWQRMQTDVYNLTVDQYQTYFADNVWVHNQKGVSVRSSFEDTAYWNPSVRTGEDGTATVTYTLPDNLTTWVIAAVGTTTNTVVGMETSEIVVSRGAVIRPILPNQLRVGDTIQLGALAHNFDSQAHTFTASIAAQPLTITDPVTSGVTIESNAMHTFNWSASPQYPTDSAQLQYQLLAEDLSDDADAFGDALTQELPITRAGFLESDIFHGTNQTEFPIRWQGSIDPEQSQVQLHLSNNLWSTVADRFSYLIRYPYGCSEQVTSRLVPLLAAQKSTDRFQQLVDLTGIDAEEAIMKGLNTLESRQQSKGSWSWWSGEADLFLTVYILETLTQADELGYDTMGMISGVHRYLSTYDPKTTQEEVITQYGLLLIYDRENQSADQTDDGAEEDQPDSIQPITTFTGLEPQFLAMAVQVNYYTGITDPEENGLTQLMTVAGTSGDRMFWQAGSPKHFGSRQASTARVLRTLLKVSPDAPEIDQAVRFLVANHYQSKRTTTYGSSQMVAAAAEYYQEYESRAVEQSYTVFVDGTQIAQGTITESDALIEPITIPMEMLNSDGSTVRLDVTGERSLYATLYQDIFKTGQVSQPQENGLTISTRYVNQTVDYSSLVPGDTVEVELTVENLEPGESRYLLIEDELPSGMIPVNTTLANERSASSGNSERRSRWANVQTTQTGARIYVSLVSGKTAQYRYLARVVNQGEFYDPPARAELMYQPEVNARTGSDTITITDTRIIEEPERLRDDTASVAKDRGVRWAVVGVFIVGFLIVAAYVIYWVLPEPKQKQVRQQIKQAKQKLKGLLHRHD